MKKIALRPLRNVPSFTRIASLLEEYEIIFQEKRLKEQAGITQMGKPDTANALPGRQSRQLKVS